MPAELDRTLAALADPQRRAIVERLRQAPARPSELAAVLHLSRPKMSRHLRVLRSAGLIEQAILESDARVRPITLKREALTDLRTWIEELEAFWSDQLQAFKAHAERSVRRRR